MSNSAHHMLIDGQLVAAEGGRTYDNINPATEEVIGQAPSASRGDVERAVGAARRAFNETDWSTNVDLRKETLSALQAGLRKNAEEIRDIVVSEAGSPVMLTYAVQQDIPIEMITHFIDLIGEYEWERELPVKDILGGPARRIIRKEAAGAMAAITPWNFPFYLNIGKVGATLAAGCTTVLKAAPETPWSATVLARIAAECGVPAGVLNVITTDDNSVAEMLTTHDGIDGISFTGSTATGKRIMANAAQSIKRLTLELGGKSSAIFLDDADLVTFIPGVAGGICGHAGQGCATLTRILVPRNRLGEATEIARAAMEQVPYGDPTDPNNLMGPLISARQRERVLGYIESGKQDATLVLGGGRPVHLERGFYVEPTLFSDVPPDCTIAQEEIFGPVLSIIAYDGGDDDAIRIADATPYGLSGGVVSADQDRAMAVARRLRTGTCGVNGAQYFDAQSPFGGYKQSGLGREWGVEGLEDYLETKTIAFP